ncbi:sensor histidine kinase [Paludibacterium paludis]|uniref:histidine kinase n=1 Tax=Paludibacterium paludis TaxID=1225769 RepID=A0A918UBE8_9NEIS|nr:ATP-binding protein [Paludibacterium paludis]GGY21711.1 sensor histidine kinase [Paludibacterium paludis]
MRNQRLLAAAPDAFGGWRTAWRELEAAGVPPDELQSLTFTGFPLGNIVHAVAQGRTDAGVIPVCLIERMERDGSVASGALRVLAPRRDKGMPCGHSTRLYPDWPLAALRDTPEEAARRLAVAVLTAAPDSGIGWTIPEDYGSVRELMRELRVGPYAHLAPPGLAELIRRYWYALAAVATLLAALAWHSRRIDTVVRLRTAELREALAARDLAQAEARRRQDELDHAARLGILGELSTTLAHELAQPLTSITNYANGLMRNLGRAPQDTGRLAEAGRAIRAQAERAEHILRHVRQLARKAPPERRRVELAELISPVCEWFLQLHPGIAPGFTLSLDANLQGRHLLADPLQIEQVLLNLLQNAADAMAGQPASDRRLAVDARLDNGQAFVTVCDSGPGLPPELAERLFEPFFTTRPQGLGLGLSICRSIVERHGGHLQRADTPPESGMTMAFTLPLEPTSRPGIH